MKTVPAIYENGVFHPTVPINLPERTSVEIVLPNTPGTSVWGDGLRRCAGALANRPELDDDLDQIVAQRQLDHERELPE